MKSSLRISTNSANSQDLQTLAAPVTQESTRAAYPQLDFTGGAAKWLFDKSKLQSIAN